jgi:hypothetical protein
MDSMSTVVRSFIGGFEKIKQIWLLLSGVWNSKWCNISADDYLCQYL